MDLQNIRWGVEDGIGIVTFDRPKALNALDRRTLTELDHVLDGAGADRALRGLILTGAGDKAFVAGADIAELSRLSPQEAQEVSELGQRAFARLEKLPIPTAAAVNGFALGGGCEVAMACDLIYASQKARFGLPEATLGLIPGFGGTLRLARRVGLARAKELIFTGDMIDAPRAEALGLALEVLPADQLLPHVLAQLRKIASRGPLAVAAAKRVMEAGADLDLASGCGLEAGAFGQLFASQDAREGMKAFLEKRPPSFKGT
jgi:enoyl-CoA hydratase